jgi:PadR family transcriptional regulator, regulatory protein PadR
MPKLSDNEHKMPAIGQSAAAATSKKPSSHHAEGLSTWLATYLLCKRGAYLLLASMADLANERHFMKGTQLGEFEEVVLLTIVLLGQDAYSAAVVEELTQRLDRPMRLGAVHRTMQRLEEKGLVHSRFGEATAERGGRRKRLFTLTSAGQQAIQLARQIRYDLWTDISKAALGGVGL